MTASEKGAALRNLIINLDRLWGDAGLGLALCDLNRATVAQLADATNATVATTRRRLERLISIKRVSYELEGTVYFYLPNPVLCERTIEILERFPFP